MKAVYMLFMFVAIATIFSLNSIMADETTEKAPASYMGVDANDPEAVAKRQKELGHEKWKELFGEDADIDHMDFSPDFSNDHFSQGVQKVKDALKSLLGMFTKKPESTTTDSKPDN